ncbi:hypothetical protein RRG08_004717 [Elysia crispata]|uniref:Uncharacterized protein n=1 Tax=Elysia crispata TaxID=231223 RepID=A0AAE0YFM5_9GAST|nr:hypothetical protein RRG08_004717 [Elysia crispata]
MKLVLHQSGGHTKLVLHQSGAHIKLVLHQSGAHNAGDTIWFPINLERTSNWFSINLERTTQVTQTGSQSIWSAHHRRHKLNLHQSGAHNAGDTNWFSIDLERTSQVTQSGSPSIWSAHHRRHKLVLHQSGTHIILVLHQSGAHITGEANWVSINLDANQTGSPSIWSPHQTHSPSI